MQRGHGPVTQRGRILIAAGLGALAVAFVGAFVVGGSGGSNGVRQAPASPIRVLPLTRPSIARPPAATVAVLAAAPADTTSVPSVTATTPPSSSGGQATTSTPKRIHKQ